VRAARDRRMSEAALRDLLHLRALPGIGDVRFRRLLVQHGTAARALRAPLDELGERAASARDDPAILGRVERSLQTIAARDVEVLLHGQRRYPRRLRQLAVPPPVLFARGRLNLLRQPAITVVGSRHATQYGLDVARLLSGALAREGYVIVSGLAQGIDRAAHEGCLEAGGDTIAIVGSGIDVVFPHEHEMLQERIAREGLLLTEFLPGEPPLRHNFPRRNRILAALGLGVLVVEAKEQSGVNSTVSHALDLNRDVFAVPGPIGRPTSAGTNALIRDGAKLVTDVDDILAEVRLATRRRARVRIRERADGGPNGVLPVVAEPDPETPAGALWRALGPDPKHVDELAVTTGLTTSAALTGLLELELEGRVTRRSGMRFSRC